MRKGLSIQLALADKARLERLVTDGNTLAKIVWRARIVLATANGIGTMAIMRQSGKSKPCVWRWQDRYMAEGVDGLLRDKTRPPGKKPLRNVLARTTPPTAAQWSVRSLESSVCIRHTSMRRIWVEAGLKLDRSQIQASTPAA